MRAILERLVAYGDEWLSVRGELPQTDSPYLGEDEWQLIKIILDAKEVLKS